MLVSPLTLCITPLSAVVPRLVVIFFPACEGLTMLVKLHKAQMRRME